MPITKRGSSFQARVTHQGQTYRKQFPTLVQAEQWESQTWAAVRAGRMPDDAPKADDTLTLGALFRMVDENHWSEGKSRITNQRLSAAVCEALGSELDVRRVTTPMIDAMVRSWLQSGNTGSTVNRKLAVLSYAMKWAHRRELISSLPHIPRRKEGEGRMRFLTVQEADQIIRFFQSCGQVEIADLIAVALDTGMRLGELLAMTRTWIKPSGMAASYVELPAARTKTGRSRVIPLTTRASGILRSLCTERPSGCLFNISVRAVEYRWDMMRQTLGFGGDVVFHTLRHTFGSWLVQRGVPIEQIQKLMGHTTITMTLRYAKLNVGNLESAISVLEGTSGRPVLTVVAHAHGVKE